MIADSLKEFARAYPGLKTAAFSHNNITRLITETIPDEIVATLNLSDEEYLVRGSVGQGQWAEIPWIAIMHRGVTKSTQSGFYNVILLTKNLDRAYISTGLGWTQFAERYGNKQGKEMVGLYAKKLVDYLTPAPGDIIGEIDLAATASLGKGYELSNIISSEVIVENINDVQLTGILARHLEYYRQLRESFGADLFYGQDLIERPVSDTEESAKSKVKALSTSVNKARALSELQSIADTLPPAKRKVYVTQIVRNKAFADYVKQRANYICEICGRKPFIKKGGQPYAEADHVDPLYTSGVDHPDNMRCLCAQCHRVMTYGSETEILKLA
jgi:5-methylcytosine-specific restriction protein A